MFSPNNALIAVDQHCSTSIRMDGAATGQPAQLRLSEVSWRARRRVNEALVRPPRGPTATDSAIEIGFTALLLGRRAQQDFDHG
jgi:hypothetical protein